MTGTVGCLWIQRTMATPHLGPNNRMTGVAAALAWFVTASCGGEAGDPAPTPIATAVDHQSGTPGPGTVSRVTLRLDPAAGELQWEALPRGLPILARPATLEGELDVEITSTVAVVRSSFLDLRVECDNPGPEYNCSPGPQGDLVLQASSSIHWEVPAEILPPTGRYIRLTLPRGIRMPVTGTAQRAFPGPVVETTPSVSIDEVFELQSNQSVTIDLEQKTFTSYFEMETDILAFGTEETVEIRRSFGGTVREVVRDDPDDIEPLRQRYLGWAVGDRGTDYGQALVATRYQALRSWVASGRNRQADYDFTSPTPPFVFGDATSDGDFRRITNNVLFPLALSYRLRGPPDDLNPDQATFDRLTTLENDIVRIFNYLDTRGWRPGVDIGIRGGDDVHQTGELKFGGSLANRLSGYSWAVFLTRDLLERRGILDRELAKMHDITRFVAPADLGGPSSLGDFQGFNADGIRTLLNHRLLYALSQPPAAPNRARNLRYLRDVIDRALAIAPGWADLIKPDHVGYHHRGVYGNGYAPPAYHTAALMSYILRDSDYAVPRSGRMNLANALLAYRLYANKYDIPLSLAGRFPKNLDGMVGHVPAFAYAAESLRNIATETNEAGEVEVLDAIDAAFLRLWDPDHLGAPGRLADAVSSGITFFGGLGGVEVPLEVAARPGLAAESDPAGSWVKPYGGFVVHRRDDWMALAKGVSKYIWDYEGSSSQNVYGRNASLGSLFIFGAGQPMPSAPGSGLVLEGWDWNRIPGTTAQNYPITDLPTRDRTFSDSTFLGGVTLSAGAPESAHATFAVRLKEDNSPGRVRARKSYFFFGDLIVALGTDVITEQTSTRAVQTTLFQTHVPATGSIWVDGTQYSAPIAAPLTFGRAPRPGLPTARATATTYPTPPRSRCPTPSRARARRTAAPSPPARSPPRTSTTGRTRRASSTSTSSSCSAPRTRRRRSRRGCRRSSRPWKREGGSTWCAITPRTPTAMRSSRTGRGSATRAPSPGSTYPRWSWPGLPAVSSTSAPPTRTSGSSTARRPSLTPGRSRPRSTCTSRAPRSRSA